MHAGKLLKPAIWSGPYNWGWVKLTDLGFVLNRDPRDIWYAYREASIAKESPAEDKGVTEIKRPAANKAIIETKGMLWCPNLDAKVANMSSEFPGEDNTLFVPCGWAKDVMQLHDMGAVRATRVKHLCSVPVHECPEGAISCTYPPDEPYIGYAVVGIKEDGSPIDTRMKRPVSSWEHACCQKCFQAKKKLDGHNLCTWPLSERVLTGIKDRQLIQKDPLKGYVMIF